MKDFVLFRIFYFWTNGQGFVRADDIFSFKLLIEKSRNFNLETHLSFTDYEKTFGRIYRSILSGIGCKRGYPKRLIDSIKSLYYRKRIVLSVGRRIFDKRDLHLSLIHI